jgi:hypothetical protein
LASAALEWLSLGGLACQPRLLVQCPREIRWHLVGNPFAFFASMPAGVTAFHWNPNTGQCDAVQRMAMGESAWMYSATATTVAFTPG